MVKHVVIFKFTGTPKERYNTAFKFKEALLTLPDIIGVLQSMEVGINSNPNEDWDIVLTAVVPTMKDIETYAKHPAHIAACEIIAEAKLFRACVDYEI